MTISARLLHYNGQAIIKHTKLMPILDLREPCSFIYENPFLLAMHHLLINRHRASTITYFKYLSLFLIFVR